MPSIPIIYHESYSRSEIGLSPLRQIHMQSQHMCGKWGHGKREHGKSEAYGDTHHGDSHARSPQWLETQNPLNSGFVQELDTPKSQNHRSNWEPQNSNLLLPWSHRNFEVSISGQCRSSSPRPQGSRGSVPGTAWERIRSHRNYHLKPRLVLCQTREVVNLYFWRTDTSYVYVYVNICIIYHTHTLTINKAKAWCLPVVSTSTQSLLIPNAEIPVQVHCIYAEALKP